MHTKFTLILLASSFVCSLKSQTPSFALASQNSFGEAHYNHPGSVLTSGSVTRNSPGFLMAGYVAGQTTGFFIDRTGPGGTVSVTNPAEFQRQYTILTGVNCQSMGNVQTACTGVTAIETAVPANAQNGTPALNYAVAGSVANGCFLSFLSSNGTPVNSYFINFALIQGVPLISNVSKPLLLEASTNSGVNEYFLCGTYDFALPLLNLPISVFYAHRLNAQGMILWSREYLCVLGGYMQARDMLESPYTQNLVVVGKTGNSALMVELDAGTGGNFIATANVYTARNYPCAFSSITRSDIQSGTGAGYVIGGENRNLQSAGGLWFLKMSPAGNVTWNTLVRPTSDSKAMDITEVIERRNWNNAYEYYGVTTSTAGAMVIKLNQGGLPVPPQGNEFVYNSGSPGNASTGRCLSFSDFTGVDEGLHIFGNDKANGINSHYKIQAYFSGHAGCNSPLQVASFERPEVFREEVALIDLNLPLSHCAGITINSTHANAYNPVCGPVPFILPPATNARQAQALGVQKPGEGNLSWAVYPNPVKDKTRISIEEDVVAKISLFNSLGQLIHTEETSGQQNSVELDFVAMNLTTGVYFIKCDANGESRQEKVVYVKQ